MKLLIAFFLVVTLVACQPLAMKGRDTLLYSVPVGTILTVQSGFEIPANSATVYFQGGRIMDYADVDDYYYHCEFAVRRVLEVPQKVLPGEFTITRVVYGEDDLFAKRRPEMVAAASSPVVQADGKTVFRYTTRLFLFSKAQPDVMYLDCGYLSDASVAEYMTVRDFAPVVGQYMSLR